MADAAAPETGQTRAKVFISYSRKDIAFADRLDAALKARGFEPLIDRTDIYAFEQWWERIEALIGRADTVVFVISPDAVASEIALKEIAAAASLNKRFAPVVWRRVDDKLIPEPLAKLNFIFFDDEAQFEQRADQLAEALNTDIAWVRQHTDFGEQARRWSQAKGASGLLLRSPVLEEAERWIASRPPGAPAPTDETQAFIRHSRQGATRRRNALTGSLAAGLVLALALAGLAYWQRGVAVEQRSIAQQNEAQAKTERDNAERNFKLAQKTAESLVFDIAQGLRNVQGMSAPTVHKILETAKATFEQLAKSSPDDQELQRGRAVTLNEFGTTYQTLGDLDEALKAYREDLAIMERLTAANGSNLLWQCDLYVSYNKIGDVLVAQGKLDEALKTYHEGLTVTERLADSDRSNTQWQRDLSVSDDRIGDVLVVQGKLDEAPKAYRDGLTMSGSYLPSPATCCGNVICRSPSAELVTC
jgi:tetratricopeptide (TPR) repeat protein